MSEESKKTDEMPSGEWVMPEPVFRTTEGQTPISLHETVIADDVPTVEPGFREADTLETEGLPPTDEDILPAIEDSVEPGFRDAPTIETRGILADIEPVKVKAAPAKPQKKSGCAKSFFSVVLVISIIALAIIAALVYYFFYYRPSDTVTF